MLVEQVSIKDIKPYVRNAKRHSDAQVAMIAKSIQQFGFKQPLVIDRDGVVVIGHGRLQAAQKLGHALTDAVGRKMGTAGIDATATRIVNEARKQTNHRGVVQLAQKISGYATHSNAEAVAEAFADYYCNYKRGKAAPESVAIVNVMNRYLKGTR